MKSFLSQHNYLYSQLIVLFVLTIFSGLILFGPLISDHALNGDQFRFYSYFRDNLHALNYFGEVQWWNPNVRTGFPTYYFALLGNNNGSPLFVLLGFFVWFLGLLNIKIHAYYPLWLLFFGFLIPLMLNLGMLTLSRQIFRHSSVIFLTIILTSFSPGIVFNVSDMGIELSTYGLFFVAAYLKFQKKPTKSTFLGFAVTLCMLALALSHIFLYWTIIFAPLFVVTCLIVSPKGFRLTLKNMFQSIAPVHWMMTGGGVLICLLPCLVLFSQGTHLMRATIGTRIYSYWQLSPGNPLEVLGSNIPGIRFTGQQEGNFSWLNDQIHRIRWLITTFFQQSQSGIYAAYTYLGILTLPLAIIGLLFGHSLWRIRLFILITCFFTIIILSAYSPIFSLLLALPLPLRAVSHYADMTFRLGGNLLVILAAGLGLETILHIPPLSRAWWKCFVITSVLAIVVSLGILIFMGVLTGIFCAPYLSEQIKGEQLTLADIVFSIGNLAADRNHFMGFLEYTSLNFSFMGIMIGCTAIALRWLIASKTPYTRHFAIMTTLILILVDVSTACFLHSRFILHSDSYLVSEPDIETVAPRDVNGVAYYANRLLVLQYVEDVERTKLNPETLPLFALLTRASREILKDPGTGQPAPVAMLPEPFTDLPAFKRFLLNDQPDEHHPDQAINTGKIEIVRQTYNTLELKIDTPVDALLFWRDAYFPYWRATVNHTKTMIAPAFGAYKTIVVPAGKSFVRFHFSPGLLPGVLVVAYVVFLIMVGLWIGARYRLRFRKIT